MHINRMLEEVLGDAIGVTGVRLKKVVGIAHENLAGVRVFIAIGHSPNIAIFGSKLALKNSYLRVQSKMNDNATITLISGVFTAANVMDHKHRLAIISVRTSCMAALEVEPYLAAQVLSGSL